MSETSALAALAIAAIASPAVFPWLSTPSVTLSEVGRGADAAFAADFDPAIIADVDRALNERRRWRDRGECRRECD